MTQNMFQEGLYHVFFKEKTEARPITVTTNQEPLRDVRIGRWFETIVNTHLLITGVIQIFGALASILATVTYACVRFRCSVTMMTPIWLGLLYVATGGLTIEVQKRTTKLKVIAMIVLNILCLLMGTCTLLAFTLITIKPRALTDQQRIGSNVAKGSSIAFTVQCLVASAYTLFLSWRGLRRYGGPSSQTYSLAQVSDDHTESLLNSSDYDL